METTKRIINISEKFGSWTVLEKQGKQVLCKCDCGIQKLVYSHTLTNGRSTNCGCKKRKESIPAGANFGRLKVISDVEVKGKRGELLLLTLCRCGTQKYVSKNSLKEGLHKVADVCNGTASRPIKLSTVTAKATSITPGYTSSASAITRTTISTNIMVGAELKLMHPGVITLPNF